VLKQQITEALVADIARLIRVATENINVTNLTEGSLVVAFDVHNSISEQGANASFENSRRTGDASWLSATSGVYGRVSSEQLSVESVSVRDTSPTEAPSFWEDRCGDHCIAFAVVAAVCGAAVIALIVFLCFWWCGKKTPPTVNEPTVDGVIKSPPTQA